MANDFEYMDHSYCSSIWSEHSDDVRSLMIDWGLREEEEAASLDSLETWYHRSHKPANERRDERATDDLASVFRLLTREWQDDTLHISSIRRKISHPAYLKIIGMGQAALPFIFAEMRREPSLWFWALEAITRQDILPESKSMSELHRAWLSWGEVNGY